MADVKESVRVEYAVKLKDKTCVAAVEASLSDHPGIKKITIDLKEQSVMVESSLPTTRIAKLIEDTGRQVVLKGLGGSSNNEQKNVGLGAAVCMISEGNPSAGIRGIIRFVQTSMETCVIDGTLDGLASNATHKIGIHQFGDISQGCASCGDTFQPPGLVSPALAGDFGMLPTDSSGRSEFRLQNQHIKIWDVIGRSVVVQSQFQSQGAGIWLRQACGIIARSAGLFQNNKKICACDGITIWNEKDVPIAGGTRNLKTNSQL